MSLEKSDSEKLHYEVVVREQKDAKVPYSVEFLGDLPEMYPLARVLGSILAPDYSGQIGGETIEEALQVAKASLAGYLIQEISMYNLADYHSNKLRIPTVDQLVKRIDLKAHLLKEHYDISIIETETGFKGTVADVPECEVDTVYKEEIAALLDYKLRQRQTELQARLAQAYTKKHQRYASPRFAG